MKCWGCDEEIEQLGVCFGSHYCYRCIQKIYRYGDVKLKASQGEQGVAGGSAGDGRPLSQPLGQGNHQAQRLRSRNPVEAKKGGEKR